MTAVQIYELFHVYLHHNGLYLLVSLATAAKYDLTTNIDVTDGLTIMVQSVS